MARQHGSENLKLSLYTTEDDKKEFVAWIKKNYKKSDKLAAWYGDHLFGKAPQNLDLTSQGERIVYMPAEILTKHDIDTGAEPDSAGQA